MGAFARSRPESGWRFSSTSGSGVTRRAQCTYAHAWETRAFIVADDLTGACDAAVGFTRAGFSADVVLSGGEPATGVDALAVEIRPSPGTHPPPRPPGASASGSAPGARARC